MNRDQLVVEHVDRVKRTAYGLGPLPLPREDLISAGNEALVRAAQRWNGEGSFWAFAFKRVRGAMLDEVRRWTHYDRKTGERPERTLALDEMPEGWEPPALDDPFPADLLSVLPERQQEVCLRRALGWSIEEIAALFGVTGSRVSQLTTQARHHVEVNYG